MYRYVQFVHADFRISVDIPLSSMIHSDYWRTWDGLSTKMPSIWSLCRVGKPTPGLELQKKAAVIRWTKACTPTWFGFLEKMQGALGLMTWQKQTLIEIPRYHQRMVISSLVVKATVTTQPKKIKEEFCYEILRFKLNHVLFLKPEYCLPCFFLIVVCWTCSHHPSPWATHFQPASCNQPELANQRPPPEHSANVSPDWLRWVRSNRTVGLGWRNSMWENGGSLRHGKALGES